MAQDVAELVQKLDSINRSTFENDPESRGLLLAAAQTLSARLETPLEGVQRIIWSESSFHECCMGDESSGSNYLLCLRFAHDIDLFTRLGAPNSPPQSVESLAALTNVAPDLLKRIVRHLAARHLLSDHPTSTTRLGSYGPTPLSALLATEGGEAGLRQAFHRYYPDFIGMPEYLAELGYRSPTDNTKGPYQRRLGLEGKTLFECQAHPSAKNLAKDFNVIMEMMLQGQKSYLDVCDVAGLLSVRAADYGGDDLCLLVDLGGGTGGNAIEFRRRFADVAGRVELQDLPGVIDAARETVEMQGVVCRVHNFFEPQPVRDARFYPLSIVLHDWPDADAVRILKQLAPALRPGYSTLLLSEMVLPEHGCPPSLSAMDLNMMTYLAGKERSESDWRELLDSAGFKLVCVHAKASSMRNVLECELLTGPGGP